jgi:hypothetical protein
MLHREDLVMLLILAAGLGGASQAQAETCHVPSAVYPTIQTAVDAPACSPIVVAAGVFVESPVISRSLTLGMQMGATCTLPHLCGRFEM